MQTLLIIAGALIVLIISIDMLTTILRMSGGGIVSNFLAEVFWKIFFVLGKKNAHSKILNHAGFLILFMLFFSWVVLLWLGYTLIFLSTTNSALVSATSLPADTLDKIYFVGYTLSSLGNGDIIAGPGIWHILTNIVGFSGLFFITLAITYFIPILDAVIKKRALSAYIFSMGRTPVELIKNGWNGKDFKILYEHFKVLQEKILEHSERQLAYPILDYFHDDAERYSAPLNLAMLDEALSIQEIYQIDKSQGIHYWNNVRFAMNSYLDISVSSHISQEYEPEFPYRAHLDFFGLDLSKEEEQKKISDFSERRKCLYGLISHDGWKWEELNKS